MSGSKNDRLKYMKVHGMQVVAPSTAPDKGRVINSRHVRMPDGTIVMCRQRVFAGGSTQWFSDVPIEIAMEIYVDD